MPKHPAKILGCWLLATAAFPAVSGASAASFDCRNATLAAEKTICGDANLSSLDERTAGMYFLIVGGGAPPDTIAQVKDVQSKFVTTRNACGANVDCLVNAYTTQMMFLKNIKSNLGL
jgi:uncharacterized protein